MYSYDELGERAKLAHDTVMRKPTIGIPTWSILIMEHEQIDMLAGVEPGEYKKNPEPVYMKYLHNTGTCFVDQYIPFNPLTIGKKGYEGKEKGVTTGAEKIVVNDMLIDSPETVVEHLEKFVFPGIKNAIANFNEDARVKAILDNENAQQEKLGNNILKTGYAFISFPGFRYGTYGYEYYLMTHAVYPEVMEKDFSLQADLALLNNKAAARAYEEGDLPPLYRLDHDMADSRGMLVNPELLEKIWFPHFARCLEPMAKTDVRMLWHCDGNLMDIVPGLLDSGVKGFQGFQYECGMDYEKICRMKTRDGEPLSIIAGVSVTRTLPLGKPKDVRDEMKWLVENGPETGLFLGCSSSVTPGVPWENIKILFEGFEYYRKKGRKG
ncbi:hypothetical protein GF312_05745 [Candidatus Poribacteria bacterium]|nr:hypothetical protein [Candidatus Poribacteria bacterium]